MRSVVTLVCCLTLCCAARQTAARFRVLPGQPDYLLVSPNSQKTPFPEVLSRYANAGPGWVELSPLTQLRVENAYFREGAPKHGLANFLGTEIARYQVLRTGRLKEISFESRVAERPRDQPPAQQLVSEAQRLYLCHRFFYQVLFSKRSNVRSAVLLGADSDDQLDLVTTRFLTEPDTVCADGSTQCTVFPEACTASLEMEIVVNEKHQTILWGSDLAGLVRDHRNVTLFRLYKGRLAPVELDASDREALRVPLLPGDVIRW